MTHEVIERAEAVVIAVRGAVLGGPDGTRLYDTLQRLQQQSHTHVVVDLHEVTRINPIGLGMLIGGMALMRNAGGDLYFARVPDLMQSLLVITRVGAVVECFASVEEALEAFAHKAR